MLREAYDKLLHEKTLSYINALKIFDELAEANIRSILGSGKSADQKWRSCKGALYEYAVCKAIEEIFEKIPMLNKKLAIIHGTQLNFNYRSQIVIGNWTDIMPDADFVVVDLSNSIVKAIIFMQNKST